MRSCGPFKEVRRGAMCDGGGLGSQFIVVCCYEMCYVLCYAMGMLLKNNPMRFAVMT